MTTYAAGQTCRSRDLRCVTGEDKVTSFGLIVTREASFHQSLVARFAVFEVSEPPASRRGVLCGVLDHKLNVRGRAGNERLRSAKDFVVFLRWDVTVVQSRNDCTVRERNLALAIGLNRYIVAQNGSKTVEVAFFVGHGDQLPVAVSGGLSRPLLNLAERGGRASYPQFTATRGDTDIAVLCEKIDPEPIVALAFRRRWPRRLMRRAPRRSRRRARSRACSARHAA